MLFQKIEQNVQGPGSRIALDTLGNREREVASIVYRKGLMTASEVQAKLPSTIANATVRTMLNRLVGKKVLMRQRCGSRGTFIYGPAITPASAKDAALCEFADDFFDSSLARLTDGLSDLYVEARATFATSGFGRGRRQDVPSAAECAQVFVTSVPPGSGTVINSTIDAELGKLAPGMRNVATAVYRRAGATARQIQSDLGGGIYKIRTTLTRLEDRSLIRKRPTGRGLEILYLPNLLSSEVRQTALKRLIQQHFGGAVDQALQHALQLICRSQEAA